ncbi:acyl-CoA thioesterase [Conexibacter sp. S30A1]|uniref:acyl-CoA thioesterase n=1 Tax=Conexibacter sp. S30A1 TaxID=2937800 RepID=UPI00200DB08C|nr:acyl-CoA thioesterase [Conexibacter sp. S30A1]
MQPRTPSESTSVLAHWMGIADANSSGDIHGGTIMKLVDEAAGIASVRHSRRRTVTASIDRMSFLVPIKIGQLVTFTATVNAAWRTSMEVGVRVEAEDPRTGEVRHASSAYLTFVALDDDGLPTEVPPLVATTPTDARRAHDAELRRHHRLAEREAIEHGRSTFSQQPRDGGADAATPGHGPLH